MTAKPIRRRLREDGGLVDETHIRLSVTIFLEIQGERRGKPVILNGCSESGVLGLVSMIIRIK